MSLPGGIFYGRMGDRDTLSPVAKVLSKMTYRTALKSKPIRVSLFASSCGGGRITVYVKSSIKIFSGTLRQIYWLLAHIQILIFSDIIIAIKCIHHSSVGDAAECGHVASQMFFFFWGGRQRNLGPQPSGSMPGRVSLFE